LLSLVEVLSLQLIHSLYKTAKADLLLMLLNWILIGLIVPDAG